ncbi:hypothetical protein [Halomarina ordinaria]|uniref:Uncharacterized protein n=1 Tax=Halomarina ordinaria TaxID=3033939 RepID=A0ABD5U8I0_9EURY|nr:hypothetical protein [Halomarina sp. PSRA2]
MELDCSVVDREARAYERREPFHEVERDQLETLPDAVAAGDVTWKDVEWVVWWYFRRHLGAYPHRRRLDVEERFRSNDWEDVREMVEAVGKVDTDEERLACLETLDGVDTGVASALLQYLRPDAYLAVDERTWDALRAAGVLSTPYPDPPSTTAYQRYLERCRTLAERCDVDLQTVYRALWRLGGDES